MEHKRIRHVICPLRELPPGHRRIVRIGRRSIGIFNIEGRLFAIKNRCPHQGAELCRGTIGGTMVPAAQPGSYQYGFEGRILRCPWHFWEFDIFSGELIFAPDPRRVKTYDVALEGSESGESTPKLESYDVAVEDRLVVLYL